MREVVAVAEAGDWTPAQVAYAWLRSRPGTVIPLLGATTEQQLTGCRGQADRISMSEKTPMVTA
ncbi:hypothetical protein GCM10010435_25730 [Winogradskya consettensis]|uniref:NADP-dependent oxidoreductase domain-containing protein n=1 Tax=Winogradskya consettensis TaxID=113560 RepID=A0A919VSL4_9ACTN|nr:aldo/keto reductase [Actinoplanes consettensis]GIM67946.1 hypothetical protein Aco04nite_08520 [Actinoplanes consettensis]